MLQVKMVHLNLVEIILIKHLLHRSLHSKLLISENPTKVPESLLSTPNKNKLKRPHRTKSHPIATRRIRILILLKKSPNTTLPSTKTRILSLSMTSTSTRITKTTRVTKTIKTGKITPGINKTTTKKNQMPAKKMARQRLTFHLLTKARIPCSHTTTVNPNQAHHKRINPRKLHTP
jgi:hypothetical protein